MSLNFALTSYYSLVTAATPPFSLMNTVYPGRIYILLVGIGCAVFRAIFDPIRIEVFKFITVLGVLWPATQVAGFPLSSLESVK